MGRLECSASDRLIELDDPCVIGRSRSSTLVLDDPSVSSLHAVIRWDGEHWMVRDSNSRNGTWVDGRRVEDEQALEEGASLHFGSEGPFVVSDIAPPHPVARCGDELVCGARDHLLLGDDVVLRLVDARWLLCRPTDEREVADGDVVEVDGHRWQLSLPERLAPTVPALAAPVCEQLVAHFAVSSDEEHVQLVYETPQQRLEMPRRVHDYMLLTLARRRHREAEQGPASEAGWVERRDLVGMFRRSENVLYTWVHRARRDAIAGGVLDGWSVLEGRGSQIRFGVAGFREVPLD